MIVWRCAHSLFPVLLALPLLAGGSAMARSPSLPTTAPVPQSIERPTTAKPSSENLDASASDAGKARPAEEMPEKMAAPPAKPAEPGAVGKPENSEKPAEAAKEPETKTIPPDPRSAVIAQDRLPADEIACRSRLKTLGVEFEEHKAESDPAIGCAIPYPLVIRKLGKTIDLEPGAEMNCQMAEAAADFVAKTVMPAAKSHFSSELTSISQASAYVCRPRHNGRKMSEHAFGNALDIADFTLANGKKVSVVLSPPENDAKFLDLVRKAACGPFKTVLGPGSDADHAMHFHFDLEPRRNGGTFCQ